ncbi:hypothetical protein EVAR_24760_1 [Eumeta japonica]|uniref:Uncharacterized protein n=1 Tax=Eumeta variegata TaxID=151549 RepID=A0A4C1VET9_EUMVA|nr:hypothetical protein EVAR_24760_1 [Eumeta japonica]
MVKIGIENEIWTKNVAKELKFESRTELGIRIKQRDLELVRNGIGTRTGGISGTPEAIANRSAVQGRPRAARARGSFKAVYASSRGAPAGPRRASTRAHLDSDRADHPRRFYLRRAHKLQNRFAVRRVKCPEEGSGGEGALTKSVFIKARPRRGGRHG